MLALGDAGITTITRFGDTGVLPLLRAAADDSRAGLTVIVETGASRSTHPQNPEREDPR